MNELPYECAALFASRRVRHGNSRSFNRSSSTGSSRTLQRPAPRAIIPHQFQIDDKTRPRCDSHSHLGPNSGCLVLIPLIYYRRFDRAVLGMN